jgi:hypothetical protein
MTSVPPEPPTGSETPAAPPLIPPPPPQEWAAPPPAQPDSASPTKQESPPPAQQDSGPPTEHEWAPPPGQPDSASPTRPVSAHRRSSPSTRGRGFNAAAVNPKDLSILAAGLLAFIFSFVSYYSYSLGPLSKDFSAWDGFFGWCSTLLALLSAALLAVELFAPQGQLGTSVRLVVLGGFALATVFVIIAGFVDSRDVSGTGIASSRGAGYYLSLIVILAGAVLSFLRLRETGGKLPWKRTA